METISLVLELNPAPREVLIVDQTVQHPSDVREALNRLSKEGRVKLFHRSEPSIPAAMNCALQRATGSLVLFLDDDIVPSAKLLQGHATAFEDDPSLWATVGQVVQPWQQGSMIEPPRVLSGLRRDFDFPFHSTLDADVENVMAGNLCVKRDRALSLGGFDENFAGPAYRFETDFARRLILAGGKIRFLGSASIKHLHLKSGGTRAYGNHLTSVSPLHGLGDYYYAFRHAKGIAAWAYSLKRLFREVRTRFHLTHPWWIPVKLTGEIRALIAGRKQARKGPNLLASD